MKAIYAYLNFDGNAREAMKFYAECLGADLWVMTFAEAKVPCPDAAKDRVMHAKISKGSAVLMASDTMPEMPFQKGNNFSISVDCESPAEAEKLFSAFSRNAKINMPIQETFWAHRFGMLTDQFGVNWMFNCEKEHS